MTWTGSLDLHYRCATEPPRCLVMSRHEGPLRVLAALYPEGARVCHSVLVHPPGGLAGGDTLALRIELDAGSHALLTTPGATRYYRSAGEPAVQTVEARLCAGARLEWLPLESLVHPGALAESRMRFDLAPGAEMIGRDVIALGLPASGQPFDRGRVLQQIELPGVWLERGTVAADDAVLLDSPLGLAGYRVVATLWFAAGGAIDAGRRDALLAAARDAGTSELAAVHGATAPHSQVVVVRALAHRVEPAMQLLDRIWASWRLTAWQLPACVPRVWRT